jgi:hypothetical protein
MKLTIGKLVIATILILVVCVAGYAQKASVSNKAGLNKWASNEKMSMKVSKVEVATSWSKLGKLIRFGKAEEGMYDKLKKDLAAGTHKIVLVYVEMRNDSTGHINLGWHTRDDMWGYLHLRGEEGTQIKSSRGNYWQKDGEGNWCGGSDITGFLQGGLPENSLVAPKASIKGKVAFVTRDWFVPVKLFTKPGAGGFGKTDLIITLK